MTERLSRAIAFGLTLDPCPVPARLGGLRTVQALLPDGISVDAADEFEVVGKDRGHIEGRKDRLIEADGLL